MNILMLTNEYPNDMYPRPDSTWVVPFFCRAWVRQGHRVVAINNAGSFPSIYYKGAKIAGKMIAKIYDKSDVGLSDRSWSNEFSFMDEGVTVYNFPMMKFKPGGKYGQKEILKQVEKIVQLLDSISFSPDVITGHWVNPQLDLVCRLGSIYQEAKTAFVFHGDYVIKYCKKFDVGLKIKRIHNVGCRSKTAADSLMTYLSLDKEPFVCASGIPDDYLQTNHKRRIVAASGDCLKIFTAGRLVQYKNIDIVISSCSKAFKPNEYKLGVAGDGPLRSSLQNQVNSLGLSDSITLFGKIPRIELQEKMGDSDIFVLISKKETFGLVYLEAMLKGCIVIASRKGGVDGIINDGENGFLCEEGNESELIQLLKKIKQLSYEEKKSLSQNATFTASYYSDSKVAERYLRQITL